MTCQEWNPSIDMKTKTHWAVILPPINPKYRKFYDIINVYETKPIEIWLSTKKKIFSKKYFLLIKKRNLDDSIVKQSIQLVSDFELIHIGVGTVEMPVADLDSAAHRFRYVAFVWQPRPEANYRYFVARI